MDNTQALTQPPKLVRILGAIYCFHGVYFLATAFSFLYLLTRTWDIGGIITMSTISFLLICYAFFAIANSILKGYRSARQHGLILSVLAVVFAFYPLMTQSGIFDFSFFLILHPSYWNIFPLILEWLWKLLDLTVGATSLLCIYYLTRPQVKAFLTKERKRRKVLDYVRICM